MRMQHGTSSRKKRETNSSATSEERFLVQQIQQNIRDTMDKFIEQDKKK